MEMIVPPSQKLDRVVDVSPDFTLTPVIKLANFLSMEDAAEMETDMTLKRTVRKPVEEMIVPPGHLLDRVVDISPAFTLTPVIKLVNVLSMEDAAEMETDMPLKRLVRKPVEEMIVPLGHLLDRVVDISPAFTLTPVIKLANVLSMEDAAEMETDMPLKRTVRKPVGVSNRCVLLKCESHMLLNFKMS